MNHHAKDRNAIVMPDNRGQFSSPATLAKALLAVKKTQRLLASDSRAFDVATDLSPR